MKEIKITIAGKEYSVKLAETEEQKEAGLQNVKSIENDEGMLFIFDRESQQNFWMKNTLMPLDVVFIGEDLKVNSVLEGKPNSTDFLTEDAMYVLEVNANSGIKSGDLLEFISDKKLNKMLVLNNEGQVQMELEGGERIFSRPHTKILIKFAKKADLLKTDSAYKALGKRMFKFLDIQENTAPEYV